MTAMEVQPATFKDLLNVKQSFFNIYSDNNLDNLYHQTTQQLSDTSKLPPALDMGDYDNRCVDCTIYLHDKRSRYHKGTSFIDD